MGKSSIALEIVGLQAQLDALKSLFFVTRCKTGRSPKKKVSFADLYGIWKGKVRLSFEEIKEAEYKLPKSLTE